MRFVLLFFVLWTICFEFILSSHFYGGTASLIPSTDTGSEHTSFYTVYERTSYTSLSDCRSLKNSSNDFYGWSLCFNSTRHISPTYEFKGGNWASNLGGAAGWTLSARVMNERREDNGLSNTSPVTESLPLLPLQVNCAYTIPFPVYDVDDDTIRCRFANGTSECGSACDKLTGAVLNGTTCTLSYTATSTGNLPLAIQVEDFYNTSSVTSLGSVPLQILVHAVDKGRKCNELPEIILPNHSSLFRLRTNSSFTLNITARSIYSLSAIDMTLYPEMTISAQYNTWSDASYQFMSTNLVWTPTTDDERPHIVCMSARDFEDAPSEQTCVTLLVSSAEVACNETMVGFCNKRKADCFVIDNVQDCTCRNGYTHNQTTDICDDIDECEGDHPCDHACENMEGGYTCVCNEGFQLDVDQVTCKDCDEGTFGSNCFATCLCVSDNTLRCNTVNGSCTCREGWMGDTCNDDIDECEEPSVCPSNSQCINTNGSFICNCLVGYQKTGSGICTGCQPFYFGEACAESCECNTTTTLMCDTNNGSCKCKAGWKSSDCSLDVDECKANTSICSDVTNSECKNYPGGYECECQSGFYKEGRLCIDIDECQEDIDRCNQDCENTEGSFTCKCFHGYHGDGKNCTECDTNTFGFNCSLECPCNTTNSQTASQSCDPSTGVCLCKAEWTGANCTRDVNECQNTSLCGADDKFSGCHNLEGGYSCECYIGYKKNHVDECIPDTSSSLTTKSALPMKEVKLTLTLEVSLPAGTNLNISATYAYYETAAIETLTAYYKSFGITSVVIVINSLREGSLEVDFTLLYEDVDDVDQKLGAATVQLTKGADLVFQNQNVSLRIDLPGNLTDSCDIFESLFGQCRIGFQCQVGDNEPICKENIVDCKVLEVPDHVLMDGTVTTYGGRLRFTCTNENDVLVGSGVIECLGNGLWNDSVPDCHINYGGSCNANRSCLPRGARCIDGTCHCQTGIVDLNNEICDTMPLSDYGTEDDTLIDGQEECIGPVTFTPGFMVFGASRQSIYICSNGFVSLDKKYTDPKPPNDTSVLADFDVLAPFYADTADESRKVYYRHYDIVTNKGAGMNKDDVASITTFIRKYGDKADFQATFVLFVTWVEVKSFDNSTNGIATFQLVLATDGKATFALYIYEHNGMKWTSSLPNPDIWIGYHLNVNHSESSLFSFTQRALNIDQFATTKGVHGVTLYRFNTLNEDVDTRVVNGIRCYRWYNDNYERKVNSSYNLPDCPCDLRKLTYDPWYSELVEDTNSPDIVCTTILPAVTFSPYGKTCCYNTSTNLWVQVIPYAGGLYHFHPDKYVREHTIHDLDPKATCCYGSNLCDKYYELHPIGDCYRETWFGVGTLWGDPHLKTLDNKGFTFNGLGEFHLLQVEKDGKLFQLQARTERPLKADNTSSEATVFSAFAADDGNNASFHVELNRNKTGFDVYGNLNDLTKGVRKRDFEYTAKESNLMITKRGDTLIAFFPSFGISLNVTTNVRMFSTVVLINNTFQGKTRGLLGNFNGDPSDDFILPNGTKLNANITEKEIFYYGMNWSIDANSSVFKYTKGKGHANFHNASYVPKFLEDVHWQERPDVIQVCGEEDNVQCIFDFVFTDSEEIANQTLRTNKISVEDKREIDLKIPSIGGCILDVINIGQEVVCQLYLPNNEDKIIVKGLAEDKYELNNVTNTFNFKIENPEPVIISVSAESNDGKKSPETPINFWLCNGCSGRGFCRLGEKYSGQYKVAECICDVGYDGPECEDDFDGCSSKPCSQYRNCTDLSPEEHLRQNRSHTCGPCPDGFNKTDQEKCVDIDECKEDSDGCDQECINTDGGYECACKQGYRLDTSDRQLCNDINECEEAVHGCEHVCMNTPGSFKCMCNTGFILDDNIRTCSQNGTEVCDSSINCSKSDGCTINDDGEFTCFCNSGYRLTDDNTCEDIDECKANVCPQDCVNMVGSFQCTCYIGYSRSDETTCQACKFPSWGVNCSESCDCPDATGCDHIRGCFCESGWTGIKCDEDIDECTEGIDVCIDVRTRCINTDGSFYCGCIDGYQLSHTSPHECTDIDECSSPLLHECEQTCTNVIGGYTCGCTDGYIKVNDTHCQDVDECALQIAGCQHICENFYGSFNCYCEFGYILEDDRRTCIEDENPCEAKGIYCDQVCITDVINQTYSCGCYPGFKLGADELFCLDVQECDVPDLNKCGGNSTCYIERGSYRCECPIGFQLQNDARTCTECDDFHHGVDCSQTCSCIKGTCDNERGCICDEGWTGVNCDQDMDECQSIDTLCVGQNVKCLNTLGGYRCVCLTGFQNNTGTCQDIDECDKTETHDCDQTCENTIGGYLCLCNSGFLRVDSACKDIDECLLQHECDQKCENTVGSYRCSCRTGYHLDLNNRKSCQPEVACNDTKVDFCNQRNADCFVVDNVQNCTCRNGYTHNQTIDICDDIDECEGNHPCDHACENTEGGYTCVCNEGFQLDVDQVTCKDCDEGTYGSNCFATCSCVSDNTLRCNTVNGSCTCREGWMGDTCNDDIDECEEPLVCPSNSQCINTKGSFICNCLVGYQKTGSGICTGCQPFYFGEACAESCECDTTTTLMCDTNNGSCKCKAGWTSSDCSLDVDECTANTSICSDVTNSECKNYPGGYKCECQSGFYKEGRLCIDIDECQEDIDRCNQDCENTEGSFTCKCFHGYHGDGKNCTDDSFGLIIGLSTGGFVALLALVLMVLCMRVMRKKRELKKQADKNGEFKNCENKVDCPITDTCSDRYVTSGVGFNRDPSSKWFSQTSEFLTASTRNNRQGFQQVTSDNRFILYRPQLSTFTPKLLLGESNSKRYHEEQSNVPPADYF